MNQQTISISNADPTSGIVMPVLGTGPTETSDQTFIRVIEIWVPSKDRRRLELGSGLYGPLSAFETASQAISFGYDEGLPGKAWAAGHPIVLKNLTSSYFKRGDVAAAAGLSCGVALPIFAGPFLLAVIVLFCGDDRNHVGAIELWHTPPGLNEMSLVDGYYGTAEVFEWSSRHTKFMRGTGLPGQVWETGMPVILEDLGRSRRFLRWESAERVGINRGVGIPCGRDTDGVWVLTLLSALGTPIARRFELWVPGNDRDSLVFHSGYCEERADLETQNGPVSLSPSQGTLGHVWRSGTPAISTDLAAEPEPIIASINGTRLTTLVAMPVITAAALKGVVAWYL